MTFPRFTPNLTALEFTRSRANHAKIYPPFTHQKHPMAPTLPRGIVSVQHTNQDGSKTTRYRVRIQRKDFKADERFSDIDEAKQFLALSKAKKGQELIFSITEEERMRNKKVPENDNDYTIGHFIDLYIKSYVLERDNNNEMQGRNIKNILSFYKTIRNVSIVDKSISFQDKESMGLDSDEQYSVFVEGWDIRKFKPIQVNSYIKERLKKVKPVSVARELTHLSNIFSKLQYFNESLADLPNPTRHFDKSLLKKPNPKERDKYK